MRTFSPIKALALVATGCIILCGCDLAHSKADANKVLARHFQTLATNGYTEALADYGTQFFQKTTKEDWSKVLARLSSKLGTYQSYKIVNWRSFSNFGNAGSGTRVLLQCQVVYSRHSVQETFTLFKGVTDSDYRIIGHQIDGAALLQE